MATPLTIEATKESYETRRRISDVLSVVLTGDAESEQLFDTVVPSVVPEDYAADTAGGDAELSDAQQQALEDKLAYAATEIYGLNNPDLAVAASFFGFAALAETITVDAI